MAGAVDVAGAGAGAGATVVADLEPEVRGAVVHVDLRVLRPGVLEGVGEALLHDPVRREVETGRERDRFTVASYLHGQAGRPYVGHERVEVVEPGVRQQLEVVALAAH